MPELLLSMSVLTIAACDTLPNAAVT